MMPDPLKETQIQMQNDSCCWSAVSLYYLVVNSVMFWQSVPGDNVMTPGWGPVAHPSSPAHCSTHTHRTWLIPLTFPSDSLHLSYFCSKWLGSVIWNSVCDWLVTWQGQRKITTQVCPQFRQVYSHISWVTAYKVQQIHCQEPVTQKTS